MPMHIDGFVAARVDEFFSGGIIRLQTVGELKELIRELPDDMVLSVADDRGMLDFAYVCKYPGFNECVMSSSQRAAASVQDRAQEIIPDD